MSSRMVKLHALTVVCGTPCETLAVEYAPTRDFLKLWWRLDSTRRICYPIPPVETTWTWHFEAAILRGADLDDGSNDQ